MSRENGDGGEDHLAPIIPLFGGRVTRASELPVDEGEQAPDRSSALESHPRGREQSRSGERSTRGTHHVSDSRSDSAIDISSTDGADPDAIARRAEEVLVRKLRARSLSVSEARQVLRGQDLDAGGIDLVIDEFCARGYLDDALLAEHLVISGIERKGQGRVALARALAQRGIARDVIDTALGDLPDDDAERALEFARTKARSLSRLDFDTALRRLVGQLARRGYGGSVAMTAARTALSEAAVGGPTTGVRFVDSD